jgi:hypothetical protein
MVSVFVRGWATVFRAVLPSLATAARRRDSADLKVAAAELPAKKKRPAASLV